MTSEQTTWTHLNWWVAKDRAVVAARRQKRGFVVLSYDEHFVVMAADFCHNSSRAAFYALP